MSQGIDKRILRSRKAMLCALPRVLMNKRLEQVTVREITEAAGINRKTFYAHYTSLTELHEDLAQEIAHAIIRRLGHISPASPINFVAALSLLSKEYPNEFYFFICHDNLNSLRTRVFSYLRNLLAECMFPYLENGTLYAASLIGASVALYAANYDAPTPLSSDAIEEVHLNCVNRGLI